MSALKRFKSQQHNSAIGQIGDAKDGKEGGKEEEEYDAEDGEDGEEEEKGVAFGLLLREGRKKNKALIIEQLKCSGGGHPIFSQVYLVDEMADFAALFFPEYAKFPATCPPMDIIGLRRSLMGRRNAWRFCDAGRKVFRHGAVFWEALPYILQHMQIGQMGYFRSKGFFNNHEYLYPFIVVWKHPSCTDAEDDVPVIGVIFPHIRIIETDKIVNYGTYTYTIVEKSKEFGADLGSADKLYYEACLRAIKGGYDCNCMAEAKNKPPYDHGLRCPFSNACSLGAQQLLQGSGLSLHQPPVDGYYKIHYFAFWDHTTEQDQEMNHGSENTQLIPNEIGSEVTTNRVKIFDTKGLVACHFATDVDVVGIESPKILPLKYLDAANRTIHALPFHFDPYSVNQWK